MKGVVTQLPARQPNQGGNISDENWSEIWANTTFNDDLEGA